jgi:hypothetical protein
MKLLNKSLAKYEIDLYAKNYKTLKKDQRICVKQKYIGFKDWNTRYW